MPSTFIDSPVYCMTKRMRHWILSVRYFPLTNSKSLKLVTIFFANAEAPASKAGTRSAGSEAFTAFIYP